MTTDRPEMPTMTLTTTEMFTPRHDRTTGRAFMGNHFDLNVAIHRDGPNVTETTSWICNGWGGFFNRETHTYNLTELIATLRMDAVRLGINLNIIDDLPAGTSFPSPL